MITSANIMINVENVDMYKEDIISFAETGKMPFFVLMCGISYCDGTYHITRQRSNTAVMEYIISGIGTVRENNRIFEAAEGDVYFLKEGTYHDYYSDSENPWVKIWFNFRGELARQITACFGLENHSLFHMPGLKEDFEEIYKISRSGMTSKEISDSIAVCFLRIAQRLADDVCEGRGISSIIGVRLKELLDNVTDFSVSLDELVKQLYCTKSHAIREFKNMYGITPYEYLQRKRTEMAKELLKNTAMPISDIAEKLSFYDIHYFSGTFKKRTGKTPTEYRRA